MGDLFGYIIGVLGIFVMIYYGRKEYKTRRKEKIPILSVIPKYLPGVEITELKIKNEGIGLYELSFGYETLNGLFKINHMGCFNEIARYNSITIQVTEKEKYNKLVEDKLEFKFRNKYNDWFIQRLHVTTQRQNIVFSDPESIK